MKVVRAYPPNYDLLKASFPISGRVVFFSYGDTIFDPTGSGLSPSLMAHEEVHGRRQMANGVDAWWAKYIADKSFRFDEELAAHKAELEFLSSTTSGRSERRRHLSQIASRLASPLYGGMVSTSEARKMLVAT